MTDIKSKLTITKKEIEDHDTIDIAWLSTEPAYKGQGLALLLLIYSREFIYT